MYTRVRVRVGPHIEHPRPNLLLHERPSQEPGIINDSALAKRGLQLLSIIRCIRAPALISVRQ